MGLSRRWTASAVVLVAGVAGAFVIVPEPPPVITVSAEPGEADHSSIREAVDALGTRGGTVEVWAGRYAERVVLDGVRGVALRARTGDTVVLDGGELTAPEGVSGVVEIRGGSRVEVSGLEVTGYRSTSPGAVPAGVLVTGGVDGVSVQDVLVHGIAAAVDQGAGPGEGPAQAYGIAVRGDDPDGTADLLITRSEVRDLTLGAGEAISVSGNVSDWEVSENQVLRVDHTAIAALGWTPTGGTLAADSNLNRTRNGTIARNVVTDASGEGNLVLGPEGCACAGAIQVEGGLEVSVHENTVHHGDLGVVVGADDTAGATEGVDILDNVVEDVAASALVVGAGPDEGGPVERVLVRGNTFRAAGTEPLIRLLGQLSDVRVTNNQVVRESGSGALVETSGEPVVLDYNGYAADVPLFLLRGREITGLRDWQLGTRQDDSSSLGVP